MSDLSLPEKILGLDATALPDEVYDLARICLLDLLGVAAAATDTSLARIAGDFVRQQYPGNQALLFSEGQASSIGAALYGGWLIDALDAHDGHVLTKGHAGVAILPGLLALPEARQLSGRRFLGELAIGYEIAIRAGISLHGSACDYHTSGAWNCLGVTAAAARVMGLSAQELAEALGTAEFYGPRSQMMRCIDHPTMLKDGSGWGAMTGISAALLAKAGFTGAPALLLEESTDWHDLGIRWHFLETYFKRYPVCYWAQPAVEAVLSLRASIPDLHQIDEIRVTSFHQAIRLHTTHPTTTEQAQYSLPWAVACAVHRGTVNQQSVTSDLTLSDVLWLSNKVQLCESTEFSQCFPAKRYAQVSVRLDNGQQLNSARFEARGTPANPISQFELATKFRELAQPALGATANHLEKTVNALADQPLIELLAQLGPTLSRQAPPKSRSGHVTAS